MGRVLALLLVLIAFPVEARDAVWETGGFANPESVVWDGDRKVAYVSNVNGAAPDKDGKRTIVYELNGMTREAFITDRSIAPKARARPKADLADPMQIAAPIPGLIAALPVSVGSRVTKGDKLFMMEAMKMQNTVYAPCDGVVAQLYMAVGDMVESKDLLLKLRASS